MGLVESSASGSLGFIVVGAELTDSSKLLDVFPWLLASINKSPAFNREPCKISIPFLEAPLTTLDELFIADPVAYPKSDKACSNSGLTVCGIL